ncbi:MAG TPA: ROK family protein [Dermatophilaceae bacterium]|nr:ROK family protein [Dermatophilaceae bacterium]
MAHQVALGIDIGGSGIKGAPVDLGTGQFLRERVKIATPARSTPEAVAAIVDQIADEFTDDLPKDAPIGVTIPGVVQHGVVRTAANIDKSWTDCDGESVFSKALGRKCLLVNDADAAGVAEVRYGAAKGKDGLVILTTLGTGIGIALIHNGVLIPNAELGHLEIDGHDAETRAAASIREKEGLSYKEWAPRLQRYYSVLENLLWPDLFVVGGGVSRKADKFLPLLTLRTPIIPAALENAAGIVGAAALAAD